MRFWDSSALVPLVVREPHSRRMRNLAATDPDITAWWAATTECISALWRRHREGSLPADALRWALNDVRELLAHCDQVQPVDSVRERACRLLAVHPLRAADAFQLAAALVRVRERTAELDFVTLDQPLAEAARKEGFAVHGSAQG